MTQTTLFNTQKVKLLRSPKKLPATMPSHVIWNGDVEAFLDALPNEPIFDLVVSSPPYNIGKPYEKSVELDKYMEWQKRVIHKTVSRIKPTGSLCWQVGNHVTSKSSTDRGRITPLDYLFYPVFQEEKLVLRNRIVWRFGHGLHCRDRFSGRYEVIMWYTKNGEYKFNLDAVRIASKYPGKRSYRGPKQGEYSSNPKGKNPEDVWDIDLRTFWDDAIWNIPNVKSNHVEKTKHPCQFPVGLVERLVLALTDENDLVFDPFSGVASAGVAAAFHNRNFWGCELKRSYALRGKKRVDIALSGERNYRPHEQPIYDHTKSYLSKRPTDL